MVPFKGEDEGETCWEEPMMVVVIYLRILGRELSSTFSLSMNLQTRKGSSSAGCLVISLEFTKQGGQANSQSYVGNLRQ